jgi:hypothetical protein
MPFMNESCPNFEGNSDFYGLGIRIGVYLQWFSSWISNSVNPDAAATNHDTNTIFLCAILIATAVAFADGSLQLAEKYVLLLLSSGFFCTVLSVLGLRLHLLQPSALRAFRHAFWKAVDWAPEFWSALEPVVDLLHAITELWWYRQMRASQMPRRQTSSKKEGINLRSASDIRHYALSWAGVVVRSLVGCFLAILCSLTWWSSSKATADRTDPCVTTVYFFGPQDLSGSLFVFFRVATILLTIPVGCLLLLIMFVLARLVDHSSDWIDRYEDFHARDRLRKKALISLLAEAKRLRLSSADFLKLLIVMQNSQPTRDSGPATSNPEFWDVDPRDCPPLSDLLQAFMSLFSRGVDTKIDPTDGSLKPE